MRETGEARKTQADMLSNQALISMAEMLGSRLPEGVNAEIEEIHNNLLFYDEHTFGYRKAISDPSCFQTELQWACKASYAWTAQKKAKMLYETAGGLLQARIHRCASPTITFFNPLVWERDAYCDVYADYELLPEGSGYRIVDDEGNEVRYQAYSSLREGAYYRMYVKKLPSLGYRTYRIVPGDKAETNATAAELSTLENDFYRIKIDPSRGGIGSIYDKLAGREMLDSSSEWAAGQLIRETLSDRRNL